MEVRGNLVVKNGPKIRISKPAVRPQEDEKLWDELRKYARLVPFEPDPNLGRVKEIIDEIKKGTYLTPEVIDQTAARLAARLTRED